MGRSEGVPVEGGVVRAKAVFGTHTVVLVWDVSSAADRRQLAGFAIEKVTASSRVWLLGGGRHFKASGASAGAGTSELEYLDAVGGTAEPDASPANTKMLTTREAPIQAFSWCDYTCRQGEEYEYRICPAYFSSEGGDVKVMEEKAAAVKVCMETNSPSQRHEVLFNRGVAGSQAYQRRFGALPPQQVGAEAWQWLSQGLSEALIDFINRAEGPGWSLRGAFYEFTWKPALEALRAAASRGVDVSVVVDCGPTAPRNKVLEVREGAATSGRVDLKVPFAQKDEAKGLGAKWDAGSKVWFAPNAEAPLLERWGPQSASRDGPLKADIAIDSVPGLRECVVRRERSKAISHNKFIVLVPPGGTPASVWTGSTNLTESGIFGQANVAHIVNDTCIAEQYLAYWERLAADDPTETLTQWNASCVAEDALPLPSEASTANVGVEESLRVVTCPRPSLNLIDSYAAFLASARTCACLTFAFSIDKTLGSILEQESNAERYLLLEKRAKAHEALLKVSANRMASGAVLGTEVLREGLHPEGHEYWKPESLTGLNEHVQYVHTKFMLVEPLGRNPTTISGSANFSQASVRKNDENMLFVTGDTRLSDLYFVEFWRLHQHWQFRDRVSQRARDRKLASRTDGQIPAPFKMFLVADDSWAVPYYNNAHAKCREREMLLNMYVPNNSTSQALEKVTDALGSLALNPDSKV